MTEDVGRRRRTESQGPVTIGPFRYLRAPRPLHFPETEKVPEAKLHLELRTLLWQVLQERGAPHVAIEVIRDHDARDRNWEAKLHAYCQLGVGELVRFDPEGTSGKLRVWDRIDNDLTEREPSDASMPSNVLPGFWLLREDAKLGPSVRLSRDPEGRELYLTPGEADAQRIRELEAELSRRGG